MEIITSPTYEDIKRSAIALKEGQLVAFPTETVYGLGADATNKKAVSRIYSVKGRPTDHPLIVHIASIEQVEKWAIEVPDYALKLATEFWPGPITLILKKGRLAKNFITGGQKNVGLRVPSQSIALALLKEFENLGGYGIAAPSANKFGAVSPTYAQAVVEEIGQDMHNQDLILDGGFCKIGIESTIIDCTNSDPIILRSGFITSDHISKFCKILSNPTNGKILKHSGSYLNHYAPKARILINKHPNIGDGLIALSSISTPEGVVRLCNPTNDEEYANQLYSALRKADKLQIESVSVFLPDATGLGESIIDRVSRASARTLI